MDYREHSFCKQDLPHIGALCRRVRESRGVNANQLAELSGIAYSATITKFEQRGEMSPLNFQRYLNAFQSPDIVDPPLADHQIQMLQFLYEERRDADIQKRQCQFAVVDFNDICSEQRPAPLAQMVAQLENTEQPAMILDDLWFIHAIRANC
jgi:transcriptional regulator with XRE-family HTH domain